MKNNFNLVSENSDLIQREMDYNLNIHISKELLEKGLITQTEYEEIDKILKQKYNPSLSVFIFENP